MKLKTVGVICSHCGDTAGLVTEMITRRYDLWLGHVRLCRCWDCKVDYVVLFNDRRGLVTVFSEVMSDDFMSSAGRRMPDDGEIPF